MSDTSKSSNVFNGFYLGEKYFRNRLWVPPMCQYVAPTGDPISWHERHYTTLALSVGCVIVEATAISPDARVTPEDLVLDRPSRLASFSRIAEGIKQSGAIPGIQLCHAGRKGSRSNPWNGDHSINEDQGGWPIFGPTALPFGKNYATPREMSISAIEATVEGFAKSARLAELAGFEVIEIHAGHGRLAHSFFSPIANKREDQYGGNLQCRSRYSIEVARAIRKSIRSNTILAFRLSCVDWVENGITLAETIELAKLLKNEGVDLIDCTSGGIVTPIKKTTAAGYQAPFASEIRVKADIATGAVGEIFTLEMAKEILEKGQADVILMGRKLLADPGYLARCAAQNGAWEFVPIPYRRAMERMLRPDSNLIPEL